MYGTGNKKMLNMLILEILREYTDENHSLTQQEIIKLLEQNYGMECDRRSVKSNIMSLKEMGYDISTEGGNRLISREFDDAELRILIDSVLFSKSISSKQAKDLIKKIRDMGSKHFNAKVNHVSNLPELNRTVNKQAMYSLDTINDAIADKKKISFIYNDIGMDLKLHPRREQEYIVSPYQIVANNGRFYLICNSDAHDNVSHYRIDRMTDVKKLDEKAKTMKSVTGLEHGLDLPKHMAEHVYMFAGESVSVKIKTTPDMIAQITDWFGTDINIIDNKDGTITIRLNCNWDAMKYWALQYGPYVEVLEPVDLRETIKELIKEMADKYQ